MSTVLLTGGAGYIGSHCFYALVDAGIPVVILDNLSTGCRDLLPDNAIFYQGDADDEALLAHIFASHAIDTVMHFAGSVAVAESVENPAKYFENNTATSLRLLTSCITHGIKNFIFSSTASIYESASSEPITEQHPKLPLNPYASSKLMTEQMIEAFHHAYGLNYVILRYFNVAGADLMGRTGQLVTKGKATHLIKVACELATGKRDFLSIFGTDYDTPDGTCVRDYIHVSDLADAHVQALRQFDQTPTRAVFNCGYGHGYSVRDVLNVLATLTEHPLRVVEGPRRAGDPEALVADASKLRRETGWQPRHDDLHTIVKSALDFEKST